MILSDSNRINSYGFRIDLSGMDMSRFEANPVMLYRHDSERLIGKWDNIRIVEGRLEADPVFDDEDDMAKRIQSKVKRGFIRGCSVGIVIKAMQEQGSDFVATKTELMEASICPIPSDAGAVTLYDENRKQLSFDDVKLQFINNNSNMTENQNELEQLQTQLKEKDAKIATLEALIAEEKQKATSAFLEAAVKDGRIAESEKAGFEKLAATDFDTVQQLINCREAKPTTSLKNLAAAANAAKPTGREEWTYLDWMKQDSEGLKRLKLENPKEFERLQKTL